MQTRSHRWLRCRRRSSPRRPCRRRLSPAGGAAPARAGGRPSSRPAATSRGRAGAAPASAVLRISRRPEQPAVHQRAAARASRTRSPSCIADELGADVEYTWRAQRRGFFREALKEGEADLVLGVPAGFDMALTTAPYYRSTYVFVTRKDRQLDIRSLDDPALKKLKIGVQIDRRRRRRTRRRPTRWPRRGIVDNVVGFTVYGDYREENPPARIVEAVAKGDVDVAVVWGPLAGYFAKRQRGAAGARRRSQPEVDPPGLPFAFDIAMGVRKGNKELRDELDAILDAAARPRSTGSWTSTASRAPSTPSRSAQPKERREAARGPTTVARSACSCVACVRARSPPRVVPSRGASRRLIRPDAAPFGRTPAPAPTRTYEENAYALSEGQAALRRVQLLGCHAHGGGGMGPPLMDEVDLRLRARAGLHDHRRGPAQRDAGVRRDEDPRTVPDLAARRLRPQPERPGVDRTPPRAATTT